MSFLKNIFKKEESIKSYEDFWNWFQQNESAFFKAIKDENIEKKFLDIISPKLKMLREGFFCLAGMYDDNTAELIITADGEIKNIVFVEDLMNAAPKIDGWLFTPHKPALGIENVSITMDNYQFNHSNMSFYSNDNPKYPDEIDITIVHNDQNGKNKDTISTGTYIFLDNYLGELNFATTIDNITIIGKKEAQKELIPIEKLKDFLIWREKEFIEKYDGIRHDTENDSYSSFEAQLQNGKGLIGLINTTLLEWDSKASHPWIMIIEIKYDGKNNNGIPNETTFEVLNDIENKILEDLIDSDGYLNIGRETGDNIREIYFACNDFRKPSKVLQQIIDQYGKEFPISYNIFKDKYWIAFERYNKFVH